MKTIIAPWDCQPVRVTFSDPYIAIHVSEHEVVLLHVCDLSRMDVLSEIPEAMSLWTRRELELITPQEYAERQPLERKRAALSSLRKEQRSADAVLLCLMRAHARVEEAEAAEQAA